MSSPGTHFPVEIWVRILKHAEWADVGRSHDVSHMMRDAAKVRLRGDIPIREALLADSVTLVRNSVGERVKTYVMHVIVALATQMKAWRVLVNYTSLYEYRYTVEALVRSGCVKGASLLISCRGQTYLDRDIVLVIELYQTQEPVARQAVIDRIRERCTTVPQISMYINMVHRKDLPDLLQMAFATLNYFPKTKDLEQIDESRRTAVLCDAVWYHTPEK